MPQQQVPVVPFNAAAHPYVETFTTVTAAQITTTTSDVSPTNNNLQSYGWLRYIDIKATAGTAGTGGNLAADAPWNILTTLSLTDPNGAEIYGGPTWSGYDAMLAHKYGAYRFAGDPQLDNSFSNSATSPVLTWRIPLEMNALSGLGSVPNMDAQSPYKLKAIQNTQANIYQTAPTTAPTLKFEYTIRCWTVPEPVNRITGAPQAIAPLGIGPVGGLANGATVQHWTKASPAVTASATQTIAATRKGNIFRDLVLVARGSASARVAISNLPNPLTYSWDGAPLLNAVNPQILVDDFYREYGGQTGSTNVTADTGVVNVPYASPTGFGLQASAGDFGWSRFVGTVQSSRIEFSGSWGASITSLDILTNDVNFIDLTGSPYSFGFSQQLQAPAQPQIRT